MLTCIELVCLFVCLFAWLFVYLLVCLFVCLCKLFSIIFPYTVYPNMSKSVAKCVAVAHAGVSVARFVSTEYNLS